MPWLLLAFVAGVTIAIVAAPVPKRHAKASAAWRTVHGLPLPRDLTPAAYAAALASWSTGPGGAPIYNPMAPPPAVLVNAWSTMAKAWPARLAKLPPDAQPTQDGYSTESYWVALPGPALGRLVRDHIDQFGRRARGVPVDALGSLLSAAGYALPFVPGIGPAAAAALAATIALGRGKSLKEAALAGVRASLPPGAQIGFDAGVGVVLEGKPLDKATEDALFAQLPGGKAAYEKGRALAKQAGLG